MISWHLIQSDADVYKDNRYALCVEMTGNVVCRLLPSSSSLVKEQFLWSLVGGALVNKLTGKVLEAPSAVGKPPTIQSAPKSRLRPSQQWTLEKNQSLHSHNDRMLVIVMGNKGDVVIPVIGCQYPSPHPQVNRLFCWKLVAIPEGNVQHGDLRSASMPPQKMQALMIPSMAPDLPLPKTEVPGDDEITKDVFRELLFEPGFCKQKNEEYRNMDNENLKKEWDS